MRKSRVRNIVATLMVAGLLAGGLYLILSNASKDIKTFYLIVTAVFLILSFILSRRLLKTKHMDMKYETPYIEPPSYMEYAFFWFVVMFGGLYIFICLPLTAIFWHFSFKPALTVMGGVAGAILMILLTYLYNPSGYEKVTTHEWKWVDSGAKAGPAREKEVYENQHGEGSWEKCHIPNMRFFFQFILCAASVFILYRYLGNIRLTVSLAATFLSFWILRAILVRI